MGPVRRVHLLDGTYELFRHHFGQPARAGADGEEVGAVRGVVLSVLSMLADGVTHLGVATDHVIESFRNELWAGYKSGEGVPPELLAQFGPLEDALVALGVVVWPMVELEADDALASAAAMAAASGDVDEVRICTPDKDLSQCVRGTLVVQLDRRSGEVRDEAGVWARFGVGPGSIPDWLALVGDSADGFPGIEGWGQKSASAVLAHYGAVEAVPDYAEDWAPTVRSAVRGATRLSATLRRDRELAGLFKTLATLREDAEVGDVEGLAWRGPTPAFEGVARALRDPGLVARAEALAR